MMNKVFFQEISTAQDKATVLPHDRGVRRFKKEISPDKNRKNRFNTQQCRVLEISQLEYYVIASSGRAACTSQREPGTVATINRLLDLVDRCRGRKCVHAVQCLSECEPCNHTTGTFLFNWAGHCASATRTRARTRCLVQTPAAPIIGS